VIWKRFLPLRCSLLHCRSDNAAPLEAGQRGIKELFDRLSLSRNLTLARSRGYPLGEKEDQPPSAGLKRYHPVEALHRERLGIQSKGT